MSTVTDDYEKFRKHLVKENLEMIDKVNLLFEKKDMVNHPEHYQGVYGLEAKEVMRNFISKYQNAYVGAMVCSVLKYILRAPSKGKQLEDLKKAQGIITFGIEKDSGMFRNHPEGVFDGDKQIFLAPPAHMVTTLMENLFKWMNEAKERINPLILSSIFHYEFVFIHPFSDGNGRTARLWQTALLSDWKPLFKYIPIESIIRENQDKYYSAIRECNSVGSSNIFIEFMLEVILEAVKEMVMTTQETTQETTQKTTQEKILNLIRDNTSITQKEMANILGMTRDGISYNIRILREKGILERIGSTKNGEWKIYDKI